MGYPVDGVPRPGLEVPGMVCPSCKRHGVHWIAGEVLSLHAPRPHFRCNSCNYTFAGAYPVASREHASRIKRENASCVWRNG